MDLRLLTTCVLTCILMSSICSSPTNHVKIQVDVAEELPSGSWILTLSSHPAITSLIDPDHMKIIRFEMYGKNDLIDVDKYNGSVTVKKTLDRELICPGSAEHCAVTRRILITTTSYFLLELEMTIKDINDHAPSFAAPFVFLEVSELTPVNTKFKLPPAMDADSEALGIKKYAIFSKPDSESSSYVSRKFTIQQNFKNDLELVLAETCNLSMDKALNPSEVYSFLVVAIDGGNPSLQGALEVRVQILDENDNSPIFSSAAYEGSIIESDPVGTSVLTVSATDLDRGKNGKVSYNLLNNEMFSVNEETGLVSLGSPKLDREKLAKYELIIEARDGGIPSRTSTATAQITVKDINDNQPQIEITHGAPFWENSKIPFIVVMVTVSDGDQDLNGYVKCQLEDGDNLFALSADINARETSKVLSFNNEGQFNIFAIQQIDSEVFRSVNLTLSCHDNPMDGKSLSSLVVIPIVISDVNDNDPIFHGMPYKASVSENSGEGILVAKVSTTDADIGLNGEVNHKLLSDTEYFTVDLLTGEIRTKVSLDREKISSYELKVEAADKGSPSRTSTAIVSIEVTDLNDNLPVFSQMEYIFPVKESSSSGAFVGLINATDSDEGENSIIEFKLVKDPGSCCEVDVDPNSGRLITIRTAEAKRCKIQNFKIEAKNPNGKKSSSVPVTVYIKEAFDVEPVFTFPKQPFNDSIVVKYPIDKGQEIARLTVLPSTNPIAFTLMKTVHIPENGSTELISEPPKCLNSMFTLDSETGSLTVDSNCIDDSRFGHNSTFKLHLMAADSKMPFLRSYANLKVSFTDLPTNIFLASLASDPNFLIVIATVASTICLVIALSSIIACLVIRSRRGHKDKKSDVKYKMCCKTGTTVTTVTTERLDDAGRKSQLANGLLENGHGKFQRFNSSSASTLCERDSQSSDSGRGPSESDFHPANSIVSRLAIPLPTSGCTIPPPRENFQDPLDEQVPCPQVCHPSQQLYGCHQPPNYSIPISDPGRTNGGSFAYAISGHYREVHFGESPDTYSRQSTVQVTNQDSRAPSVQSIRASYEDFDQLEAQGIRHSRRILGRRDQKRSSMVVAPKNQQRTDDGSERRFGNSSQDDLNSDPLMPVVTPFYYPGRGGMRSSLPKHSNQQDARLPPPYSVATSSSGRPPKHVTFDDGVSRNPQLHDMGRHDFLPAVTNSTASSGSYNVRKADPSHKSPVSFLLV